MYVTEEIKQAFWKTFHESGEQWFNYLGTDQENEESTQYAWNEFIENLETIRRTK